MNEIDKKEKLNILKDELFLIYPNATKVSLVVEGDKIKVTPEEKYEN
jgi:hypothetical protein